MAPCAPTGFVMFVSLLPLAALPGRSNLSTPSDHFLVGSLWACLARFLVGGVVQTMLYTCAFIRYGFGYGFLLVFSPLFPLIPQSVFWALPLKVFFSFKYEPGLFFSWTLF